MHAAHSLGVVEALLRAGARPDARSRLLDTTLLSPVATSDARACAALIAGGASVNGAGARGRTPLHEAETAAVARVLLEAGAVLRKDMVGQGPLFGAALRDEVLCKVRVSQGRVWA